jgi:hypothetical protein
MFGDDLTLFQTLGPCGSNIILPDDLEHTGAGLTRCGGQRKNREAKHGHDALSEAEPEIIERRSIALDGKTLELSSKKIDKQYSKPKDRNTNSQIRP